MYSRVTQKTPTRIQVLLQLALQQPSTKALRMPPADSCLHYVYILRSIPFPNQTYVGYTTNFRARLAVHNSGQSHHTRKYRPWEIETVVRFKHRDTALAFERYLTSHSGKAFASKRLLLPLASSSR